MTIIAYRKYVAGWIDSSIDEMLAVLPKTSKSTGYALVTCLDSDPEPAKLLRKSPALRAIVGDCRRVGGGIAIPTSRLLARREEIFQGFDEVWLSPKEFFVAKPADATIVGPERVSAEDLEALGAWMTDASCSLALGDGAGLNVVTKAAGILRYLLSQTLVPKEADSKVVFAPWDPASESY